MRHFLLLLILVVSVFAQQTLPDTPAGKRAAAFLEMANSSDDDALKQFILDQVTPNPDLTLDQRVERFRRIRNDMAGAKLLRVLNADAEGIEHHVSAVTLSVFRRYLARAGRDR